MKKKTSILIISLLTLCLLCTSCGSIREHCSVSDCPYDAYAKGLCPEHYVEMAIFGSVEEGGSALEPEKRSEESEASKTPTEDVSHPEGESPAETWDFADTPTSELEIELEVASSSGEDEMAIAIQEELDRRAASGSESPAPPAAEAPAVETPAVPAVEAPAAPVEAPAAPSSNGPVSLDIGLSLDAGFVFMSFDEFNIRDTGEVTITSGNVSRTFGPAYQAGTLYAIISGTIKNQDSAELPVYDFFVGTLDITSAIGGFGYDADANDCYVYDSEGSLVSTIAPMITYNYMICVPISEEVFQAGLENSGFEFGFYEKFDNWELSKNRNQERPERLCPYYYHLNLIT